MNSSPRRLRSVPPATPRSHHGTILGTIRLMWATALLIAPRPLLRFVGKEPDMTSVAVARVLGARHALQGVVEIGAWPRWRRVGIAADLAHAATGIAFAGVDPRWRRVGLTDTAVAAAFALGGRAS